MAVNFVRTSELPMEEAKEHSWESIRNELELTAQGMAPGRLLHTAEFSLRRSLNAIELMVPKMDPALHTLVKPTLQGEIQAGSLPLNPTLEQMVAILDELLVYERQWIAGATAPSSIFSCLYLHDLSVIENEDFATIMSCILQTYYITHRTIVEGDCLHEEDFTPNLFGFSLGPSESSNKEIAVKLLALEKKLQDQVFEESQGKVVCASYGMPPSDPVPSAGSSKAGRSGGRSKKRKNKKGRSVHPSVGNLPVPTISDLSPLLQLKFGLWLRVRARRLCFLITAQLSQKSGSSFHPARAAIAQLLPMVKLLRESVILSQESPAPGFADSSAYGYDGFPNRNPQEFSRHTAIDDFEIMLEHQQALVEFEIPRGLDENVALIDIIQSDWSAPQSIIVLSQVSMMLVDDTRYFGDAPLVELIRNHIKDFVPSSAKYLENPLIDPFIRRSAMALDFSIKSHAMNRGRFRARIPPLLQDLNILHHEAMECDAWISQQFRTPTPATRQMLTSWIYDLTLSMVSKYLLISLEQELFHTRELPYVFWILAGLYENRHHNWRSHRANSSTKPKTRGSGNSWLRSMESGLRLLSHSLVHVSFALHAHGCFESVSPIKEFGSLELMYSHRLEPLRQVRSLVLPSFQDFCRDRDAVGREKSNGLFEQAIASCAEASGQLREALDHRKAPPSFAKVFIQRVLDSTEANMASYPNMMSEIQKHQKNNSDTVGLRIHATFEHSRQFPVLSVVPSKKS